MNIILAGLVDGVAIVVMLTAVVGVHELGHFFAAQACRIRVKELAWGFGPVLFRFGGSTAVTIRLFPVGGFVKLAGMQPGEFDTAGGFWMHPRWHRLVTLLAGCIANFLLAALLVTGIYGGRVGLPAGTVTAVFGGSPASYAGLKVGDRVIGVNGKPADSAALDDALRTSNGGSIELDVRKQNGVVDHLAVVPNSASDAGGKPVYLIGASIHWPSTYFDAARIGLIYPITTASSTLTALKGMVASQGPSALVSHNGLSGPIGVARATSEASAGGPSAYLGFMAFLSVALGMSNLLPIPGLDGFRILALLTEIVRKLCRE